MKKKTTKRNALKPLPKSKRKARAEKDRAINDQINIARRIFSGTAQYQHLKGKFHYGQWEKGFKGSDSGEMVLNIINDFCDKTITEGDPILRKDKKEWLKEQILRNCFLSEKYQVGNDPFALKEDRRMEAKQKLQPAINAIDTLLDFNIKYEPQLWLATVKVSDMLFTKGLKFKKKQKTSEFIDEVLKAYRSGLLKEQAQKQKPEDGSWFVGGLNYPRRKPDGKPYRRPKDPQKSSLFLHLVNVFRHFTAAKPNLGWVGDPFPDFGEPCYRTVADIANVVLPKRNTITYKEVRETTERLIEAGVTAGSWNLPQ